MCNLYSITKGQQAIRNLFRVSRDSTGNLPPLPGIFPDYMAPIVRTSRDGERVLEMMRWGFPPPPDLPNYPVTNVRNTKARIGEVAEV
ncbi:MAG: putative response-associated peptidase [Microvirga sp.]|jgi:putative SOS response-associated peptidase YedK|nr:putative response-associated peptidase [Microvirga sp.]